MNINKSLNEWLYKGTQSTHLTFDVLLQFWCYTIIFTTDIEKVCLQMQIVDPDEAHLRFLRCEDYFANATNLTLSCIMLKHGQPYFETFAVFTLQDFESMFGYFLTLRMGGLIYNHFARVTVEVASS